MIYFVKAGQFVKIGVSDNPGKRIKELQTGNPYKLELLGIIPGDEQEETEIHDAFADHHSHGEWYFYTKPVRVFIKFAVGVRVESSTAILQYEPEDNARNIEAIARLIRNGARIESKDRGHVQLRWQAKNEDGTPMINERGNYVRRSLYIPLEMVPEVERVYEKIRGGKPDAEVAT